jgi:hypothetical protein
MMVLTATTDDVLTAITHDVDEPDLEARASPRNQECRTRDSHVLEVEVGA